MIMASPFGCISTPLVAFLAIWATAITISCQDDGHGGQGGRGGRVRPVDPVQFLLTEGQPVNKVVPLPYDINLNCELIFGIQITPFVPRKKDEDDYEDTTEENNNEPSREAGEVILTLNHPSFEDGQEEILVAVDENGNGSKQETVCFKHCANITDNKGFTFSAKTDLKSTVDIKLVQETGNHQCQKNKIVVKYNTTAIEIYKKEAETNKKEAEMNKIYKPIAIVFGILSGILLLGYIVLASRRNISVPKSAHVHVEKHGGQANIEMASLSEESETPTSRSREMKRGLSSRSRRNISVPKSAHVHEEKHGGQANIEMASLNEESKTPPSRSRDMKRGLSSRVVEEEVKEKNPRVKGSGTICNRYSILIMATFVSFLITFIFAILTALASNKIK